jgi:hypothetical protein
VALIPCWECGKEISRDALNCPQCGALRRKLSKAKELCFGAAGAAIVFLIAVGGVPPKGREATGALGQLATKPKEESSLNLRAAKTLLADSPQYSDAIRTLITANGYECPRVTSLWPKGMSLLGSKLEALCGPRDSTKVDPALHYSVYPDRLKVVVCRPGGKLAGGCG